MLAIVGDLQVAPSFERCARRCARVVLGLVPSMAHGGPSNSAEIWHLLVLTRHLSFDVLVRTPC